MGGTLIVGVYFMVFVAFAICSVWVGLVVLVVLSVVLLGVVGALFDWLSVGFCL